MPADERTPPNASPNSVSGLRESYRRGALERSDLDPDPVRLFERWLADALGADLLEPNAMTLATADAGGRVSARTVLLKDVGDDGFVFYTNYGSAKARDLDANPHAALVFWWGPLERQVRVEGRAERLPRAASEAYFRSRPHGSQLGAWASRQSEEIEDRGVLERRLAELDARWERGEVPPPDFWGGYRVIPDRIEFWQGRENRLHDRFAYERRNGGWRIARLSP